MSDSSETEASSDLPFDTRWHLGESDEEGELAEFEYSLFRAFAAFDRWQAECLAAVLNKPMSSTDNAVLHVVRMKERPKTVTEVAQLLGRDDIANLQYSIRKLQDAQLIEKRTRDRRRGVTYVVTEGGAKITNAYAALRRELLLTLAPDISDWNGRVRKTRQQLDQMRGMYEQASIYVATHRGETSE